MKTCPNCNNELIAIDSTAIYSFQKRASRIYWLVSLIFIALLLSILIPKIVPDAISQLVLVIYYVIALIAIMKMYKSNKNKVVYECIKCKNKYSDNPLKLFHYGK